MGRFREKRFLEAIVKKIIFNSICTFFVFVVICITNNISFAQDTSGKYVDNAKENRVISEKDSSTGSLGKETDIGGWRISFGGTYARPKLKKANKDIHAVESQLRETAPGVEKFEDWDDILKGTMGIGISRKIDINGFKVWPNFYFAYGSGYVETKQNDLPTIYAVPMNYRFRQTYEFYQFNLGAFAELFEWKGFSATLGGYLTYGLLGSDTNFSTIIPALNTARHVKGSFREGAFGYAAACFLYYDLPFWKDFGVSVSARYDWLKFKGPTRIDDYQNSPLGTTLLNYNQHSVSDMTGPSAFIGLTYRF